MSRFKKVLSLVLVVAMTAAIAITGTMAYLTSQDSDVNVMTLGGVEIKQHEYQRVEENGAYTTDTIDNQTSYVLEAFEQNKPLYPATESTNNGAGPWDDTTVRMTQVDSYGGMSVFVNENAVDKFVTVENTGKTDAYVRTIVAIEVGTADAGLIGYSYHQTWTPNAVGTIEIDGNNYSVIEFQYNGAQLSDGSYRHANGILPAGDTSYPNLSQVYLKSAATNEDCEKLDGNGNGTLDILVLSQAVQAAGFDDAQTALDTAFGTSVEMAAEWFGGVRPEIEVEGNDKAAVMAAIEKAESGYAVVLTEDVTIKGTTGGDKLVIDKDIVLDLNGHTMTTESLYGGIDLKGGASIVNGTINHTGNTAAIKAFEVDKIENVNINVTETAGKTKGGIVVQYGSSYVNTIKDVTITGVTNGIECYHSAADTVIGSIENVKINATDNGIYINGAANIGKISNCAIKGGNIGINAYLANLWNISLNIENSTIIGGTTGIDIWDEEATNTGSAVTFNYDDATVFSGSRENIKITLQEEITCTVNGKVQTTPCDERIK